MFELNKTEEVNRLIAITKSDSGISGPELAKAHIELGKLLGKCMDIDPDNTTVVAILRGGIFLAQGIYFETGCKFETFDLKHQEFIRPKTRDIILVDSVVNTGATIKQFITSDMRLACCVINEKAVPLFDSQLYTVRVSKNSFIGSDVKSQHGQIGPDTTMRLFNQI